MPKKKKSSRKRVRRTGRGRDAQLSHRLSKTVREHFDGGDSFDEAEDLGLASELTSPEPTPRKPSPARSERPERPGDAPRAASDDAFPGRVVSLASGLAWIEADDSSTDEPLLCVLPSHLAEDQRAGIAVGDRVLVEPAGDDDHRVAQVLPRATRLSRPDPLNPREERVVAANMDAVCIVASTVRPPLRPVLIDRYLIAVQRGGADPLLVINKTDQLETAADRAQLDRRLEPYRAIDLPIVLCSAEDGTGIEALRSSLEGRTAAFVGHSGVGKSSLINALAPEVDAATGEVSRSLGTGRHTTTRSNLYDVGGFRLIDTPGIRELGLWQLGPEELRDHFPDFAAVAPACRFSNCTHLHEPDCAVRDAVEAGELPRARYDAYERIYESLDDESAR